MTELHWLPEDPNWRARLKALRDGAATALGWLEAVALANCRIDFVRTNALDAATRGVFDAPPPGLATKPVRLALFGSCTMTHLAPAIRVAGLRRGIWIDIFETDFGQYRQEFAAPSPALQAFAPTAVLLALDAHHLAAGLAATATEAEAEALLRQRLDEIEAAWSAARRTFGAVLHQAPLPLHPNLFGQNEHRLPGSPARFIAALNQRLRGRADAAGVDLIALDARAARDGLAAWHDPALWRRAKQEVRPTAAPHYGDLVGRLLAAQQGRSYKALALDLDNTLWGGVVGDDGLNGLVLGQGDPLGEAYVAFQAYAKALSARGIILAVCSKNDEANALAPFERHPEMILKRDDIACFVADWNDKASGLRTIASTLNIGLDAIVFVDDNPAERALIRRELPMVAVPEVSDDPDGFIAAIDDAGYFESLALTQDDRARSEQYQANARREASKLVATDMDAYLASLEMELVVRRFDEIGLQRIVQLINKTNQFNLTTRRYSEREIVAVMNDPRAFGLQLRLIDRFGDNGVVAIAIGRMVDDEDCLIDSWLMSCRVLGRKVEAATLNLMAAHALALGAKRLIGVYAPTAKNGMVRDHYARLGFAPLETREDGGSRAALDLTTFVPVEAPMKVRED